MFRDIGHRVERLTRVSIGPLMLAGLAEREARELSSTEVQALLRQAEQSR
jgi:16S rRNA U516 pseudouridylate synthase RsuA-like enzyme